MPVMGEAQGMPDASWAAAREPFPDRRVGGFGVRECGVAAWIRSHHRSCTWRASTRGGTVMRSIFSTRLNLRAVIDRRAASSDSGTDGAGGAGRLAAGWWVPRLYICFAAALLPWSGYLAVSLPQRSISEHYRGTWVGFDLALIVVLARIGWLAHRRNPHVVLTAAGGSTLLMTDAWFDVTTAAPGAAHTQAVLAAVLLELPAAVLSGLLARRGLRVLAARAAAFAAVSTAAMLSPAAADGALVVVEVQDSDEISAVALIDSDPPDPSAEPRRPR